MKFASEQLKRKHDYAKDDRTYEEYELHIWKGKKHENLALNLYMKYARRVKNVELVIVGNGVDRQPDYQINGDINSKADVWINGVLVEVKCHAKMQKTLTLKVEQVQSYILEGAKILYVNGLKTNNPVFTFISTQDLIDITKTQMSFHDPGWNGKKVYRLRPSKFKWKSLV